MRQIYSIVSIYHYGRRHDNFADFVRYCTIMSLNHNGRLKNFFNDTTIYIIFDTVKDTELVLS